MYRFTHLLLILLATIHICEAQEAYGLEFACKNIAQESRTSLDLFPENTFPVKTTYALSFDLSFLPFYSSYFGYIFRITDEKKQNIDLIYNVHTNAFNVVTGNEFSGISFKLDKDSLYHQWNRVRLDMNTVTHTLAVTVNGRLIKSIRHPVISGQQLHICFGANHRKNFKAFDVAPMRLRDIQLYGDGELQHHWSLDLMSGNTVKDGITGRTTPVKNPVWLRPQFSQWQLADSFVIAGNAGVAMNPATENIYLTGKDTLYEYHCSNHKVTPRALPQLQGTPAGVRTVYDAARQRLYSVFPDRQQVAVFDSTTGAWSQSVDSNAVTTFWHSNIFFSPYDSSVYFLGGYGDFRYKNEVHRYDPGQQRWETLPTGGDFFTPRYLAAAGANAAGDSLYVLGGYGSLTGDQLLNPHSLYDLLVFDVKKHTFKSIYKGKEPEEPFAFAGNLVINSAHQEYFALTFPNDRMNSSLQLIRGSLNNPVYTKLAAPFPYRFYDTKSAVHLFYCPQNDQLVAVTCFSSSNSNTQVKIYTLHFSPYLLGVNTPADQRVPVYVMRLLLAAGIGFSLFILAAGLSALKINRKNPDFVAAADAEIIAPEVAVTSEVAAIPEVSATPAVNNASEAQTALERYGISEPGKISPASVAPEIPMAPVMPEVLPSPDIQITSVMRGTTEIRETKSAGVFPAVYLFGHFTVLDKAGNDITRSFSPLLKELFLLLFLHSLPGKGGISSQKINEILWPGRSLKDAKNNRSVNIVKLKSLLDKTGAYTLVKENDKWIFHFDNPLMQVDLISYLQLLTPAGMDDWHMHHIAEIVKRGTFLQETEYSWLDRFKGDMSAQAIPLLLHYLEVHTISPEQVISICDCILNFDSLCEEAVLFKCKALVALGQHASAKKIYTSFIAEYKSIYGETFELEYTQAIAQC